MINKLVRKQIEGSLRKCLSKLDIYEGASDKVAVDNDGDKLLIRYKKGNYVGLLGTTHFALEIENKTCYLLAIGREEKFSGRGIGRQMYNIIEGFCKDIGVQRIQLAFSGDEREEYWKSLGFRNIEGYFQMEKALD